VTGGGVIRPATPEDVPAITEIANAGIATTSTEWTTRPHTVEDRLRWLAAKREAGHPVLVADDGGEVVGWAAYGDFRDTTRWPGYLPTVEHTIHVREGRWGRGLGRALLDALAAEAAAAGKRVMIGAVDGENERSIAFHLRLGFVEVGRLPGVGEQFGRRLDLVLLQRDLDA
jgi:phosphinothricin acetyltransferase